MDKADSPKTLDKVSGKNSSEILTLARMSDEARGLLTEGMSSRQYLDLLSERGFHADAVQFLAHALPKREAVWWSALCAGQVLGPEPAPKAVAALEAAKAWVIDPKDENRRASFPAAEAAEMGTPAGCTAAAAYFSGGSLAPANLPTVAPAEHITASLVASALILSAVIKEPEKAAEKYASFLQTGLEIASGVQTWPGASAEHAPEKPVTPTATTTPEQQKGAAYGYARRARR